MFVCFAPVENPKIVVAVVVENAGFGATWAGPMASIILEKYLKDTLRDIQVKQVERIAGANLMPGYLTREQYKQDSIRAYNYFKITKDTATLKKFLQRPKPAPYRPEPEKKRTTFLKIDPMLKPDNQLKVTQV